MASSSSSLRSSLGDQEPAVHEAVDTPFTDEEEEVEEIRHLFPCSWREFLELEPPATGFYEYVDGFVIWVPNVADSEHVMLTNSHGTAVMRGPEMVRIFYTPSIELVSDQNERQLTVDGNEGSRGDRAGSSTRDGNRASSTRDPASIQSDMRYLDFAIERLREDSSDDSGTERDPLANKRIYYPRPITGRLLAVVEVTSHLTRKTDLTAKWRAYARTKIPMYIIIDRGTEREGTERVIVGMLERMRSDDRQSISGDKQESPVTRRVTRSRRSEVENPPPIYYRRVYSLNEIVDCPYYGPLGLTVKELVDSEFMDRLANLMDRDLTRRADRTTELEEKKRELEEKKKELEEKKKRSDEIRQKIREKEQASQELRQEIREFDERITKAKQETEYWNLLLTKRERGSSSEDASPKHKKSRKQ